MSNKNQRLGGFNPFSYVGVNAFQPTNFTTADTNPTSSDSRGINLGDWWLNTATNDLWYLAQTDGYTATWVQLNAGGSTGILTITGNSGGPVMPSIGNINLVGDGSTITVVGTPGTNTLTISDSGGITQTLTGNSGGAVPPDGGGNVNIIGSGDITVVGTPGTSTLTITPSGSVSDSFLTQSGTATPAGGVLTMNGANGLTSSAAGSTVTITAGGSIANSFITSPATGTATPAAGVITIAGAGGAVITAAGSTITVGSSATASSFATQSGTATPAAGVLTINGANGISTSGAGSTVTVTGGATIAQSFVTSPATATATPAAGVLTFAGTGGATISTAGSTVTINIPASGATYSTGTFTPTINIASSAPPQNITYIVQGGIYTQIGNKVYVCISLTFTINATPHGGLPVVISGLPFTVSNSYGSLSMTSEPLNLYSNVGDNPFGIKYFFGKFIPGSTTIQLFTSSISKYSIAMSSYFFRYTGTTKFSLVGSYFI